MFNVTDVRVRISSLAANNKTIRGYSLLAVTAIYIYFITQ